MSRRAEPVDLTEDPRLSAVPMVSEYGRNGYTSATAHFVIPGPAGTRKTLCGRRETGRDAIGRIVFVPVSAPLATIREVCRRCEDIYFGLKRKRAEQSGAIPDDPDENT